VTEFAVREQPRSAPAYHRGDRVRVRNAEEILATLDANGDIDGMPFMPEMLQYAGREFPVYASAHKTCDAINLTGTSRQLDRTVHLDKLRCDGSAHGGCQAGCLLFWREEWLEPVDRSQPEPVDGPAGEPPPATGGITPERLAAATQTGDAAGETGFRCQATEQLRASRHISGFNPQQYVTDLRTRNVRPGTLLAGLAVLVFNRYQALSRRLLPSWLRIRDGRSYPFYRGTGTGQRTPEQELQPGDLVEIRSQAEIMATLHPDTNNNAGLWFDPEMVPACGRRARVERRVERIINESTGRMRKLRDCYVLEDVICTGFYRKFCQRAVLMYWRSAWLRRIEPEPAGGESRGGDRPPG
jgi:hypothetical protein